MTWLDDMPHARPQRPGMRGRVDILPADTPRHALALAILVACVALWLAVIWAVLAA